MSSAYEENSQKYAENGCKSFQNQNMKKVLDYYSINQTIVSNFLRLSFGQEDVFFVP